MHSFNFKNHKIVLLNELTFTYWNTKNIDSADIIIDILKQEKPILFFLSEFNIENSNDLESKLIGKDYEVFENPGCERITVLKRIDINIELNLQSKFFTILNLVDNDMFIVSLHLPSQMYQSLDSLKEILRNLRNTIDEDIGSSAETKILIIGDFNVNPYESPMINYDGFVSTNSPKAKHTINYSGLSRTTYYNPTWQLYSRNNFPGTKQFKRPSATSYDVIEFHYLDQVLISQKLLENMDEEFINHFYLK